MTSHTNRFGTRGEFEIDEKAGTIRQVKSTCQYCGTLTEMDSMKTCHEKCTSLYCTPCWERKYAGTTAAAVR